jgi:hypothetical protein
LLHHLTAQLTSGIGGGVYVCVPLACQEIRYLGLGKHGCTFDRALRALEGKHDSGILAGLARTVEVRGTSNP